MTGCALIGNSEASGAAAVEQAFLEALHTGDGPAALALTTLGLDELVCTELIDEYGDLTVGVAGVEVGSATIDGDTASVEFSYTIVTSASETTTVRGTHSLVRDGDSWLVSMPEEYRLRAVVPGDVVAEISIRPALAGPDGDSVCTTPLAEGTFDVIAFPGLYTLDVTDPTGVFDAGRLSNYVVVSDENTDVSELSYLNDDERLDVAVSIKNELSALVNDCVVKDFQSIDCPADLPEPGGEITIASVFAERYSDVPSDIEIYSDNGVDWRYRATGEEFLYLRNGVPEAFPMNYTGAVVRDDDGEIVIVRDAD